MIFIYYYTNLNLDNLKYIIIKQNNNIIQKIKWNF